LKDFLTLSTGEKIAAPQPLKAELRHLRKAQRALSHKQKGSKARNRARLDVARVHRKVANVRNDWQWKTARMLLLTFDLLAFETLELRGMQQLWGRKVGDLGFADFLRKAGWLARKLGRDLLKIDQWEPSTKNLPRVRAPAGDAAQHANIRLRGMWLCRTSRRERVS
jgi:putative transposase